MSDIKRNIAVTINNLNDILGGVDGKTSPYTHKYITNNVTILDSGKVLGLTSVGGVSDGIDQLKVISEVSDSAVELLGRLKKNDPNFIEVNRYVDSVQSTLAYLSKTPTFTDILAVMSSAGIAVNDSTLLDGIPRNVYSMPTEVAMILLESFNVTNQLFMWVTSGAPLSVTVYDLETLLVNIRHLSAWLESLEDNKIGTIIVCRNLASLVAYIKSIHSHLV